MDFAALNPSYFAGPTEALYIRRTKGWRIMTKLFEQGIEAVRGLPEDRQDLAGELLLALAARNEPRYSLTPDQIEDVKLAIAEADRGDFASEEEMAALWKKCGL